MKKLLIFSFMVVLGLGLNAQKIGVKTGLDLHKFTGSGEIAGVKYEPDFKYKPGFNISAFYEHDVSFISIRPELGFYQKGYKMKDEKTVDLLGTKTVTESIFKTTINYLHYGVDVKLNIASLPVYAILGPYGTYAIGGKSYAKTTITSSGVINNKIENEGDEKLKFGKDKDDDYLSSSFGLDFGLGASFEVGSGDLFIEAKYDLGLSNIVDSDDISVKNRGFVIDLGFTFGF